MSVQDSWDIADYINTQERPQDPRYTGDVRETRAKYDESFHAHTYYGLEKQGKLLGDHENLGEKDFLKPDVLRPRTFE
jgi:thiosulfate dehydrogenase